jgi:hypothetical protein
VLKIRTYPNSGSPSACAEIAIRPKERSAKIQTEIERELLRQKDRDHHWEDLVDVSLRCMFLYSVLIFFKFRRCIKRFRSRFPLACPSIFPYLFAIMSMILVVFALSRGCFSAPISSNSTSPSVTAPLQSQPDVRGTFQLVASCLITSTMCVWTSLYVLEHARK